MPALAFDVPSSFWNEFDSTTLHFRRVRPGDFDPIPTDLAEPFFAASGPLALPPGWHEFLEVRLNFKQEDGEFGIKPRVHLRRVPVDDLGRADHAAMNANFALPANERRAKHGWWLNEEENAQVFAAMEALIESQADAPWMLELLLGPKKRSWR